MKKKSTKNLKKIYKQILNKDRQFVSNLNKTIKNKESLHKCERFCKKDYIVEMNKVENKYNKQYNMPITTPTKENTESMYNLCKKMYCNPKCDGFYFDGYSPKLKTDFHKKLTNGFQTKYSKDIINKFKTKGALSACVDMTDYNVFHQ